MSIDNMIITIGNYEEHVATRKKVWQRLLDEK